MGESSPVAICGLVMGHGIDIVDIADFSRLLNDSAQKFLSRQFTNIELADAGDGETKPEKLAGRFAVKEAVMKALGVGWGDGIAFTDVEVITLKTGAPAIVLYRQLAELQKKRAISAWHVSISHTTTVAIASVIAVSNSSSVIEHE